MSDPKRWMDEGPPEAVERLLEAATAERPPEASLSRALTALGLGAGATGAATTAGAATVGASSAAGTTAAGAAGVATAGKATGALLGGALVKWGLVGGALVAASLGGTAVVKRALVQEAGERAPVALAAHGGTAPRTVTTGVKAQPHGVGAPPNTAETSLNGVGAPPNTAETSPHRVETSLNGAPSAGQSASDAVSNTAPSGSPSRPSGRAAHKASVAPAAASDDAAPIDAERLAEEVALVDRARGALARGDAQATLTALDEYDAKFNPRKFAPEALYLRMEALLRLGQASAARTVAQRLAARYPSSPNAARARQVLETSIP